MRNVRPHARTFHVCTAREVRAQHVSPYLCFSTRIPRSLLTLCAKTARMSTADATRAIFLLPIVMRIFENSSTTAARGGGHTSYKVRDFVAQNSNYQAVSRQWALHRCLVRALCWLAAVCIVRSLPAEDAKLVHPQFQYHRQPMDLCLATLLLRYTSASECNGTEAYCSV